MKTIEKPGHISVIGAGYVGLTTAVIFANSGIKTFLIDVNKDKIYSINRGKSPFFEENINGLINSAIMSRMLVPTTSYAKVIPKSDIIFCCVGTPDNADGSSNLRFVFDSLKEAAVLAKNGVIFVQKSTVPVGTGSKLMKSLRNTAPKLDFSYVSNPEFLREGTAVADSLNPDRIIIGGDEIRALQNVADLYLAVGSGPLESSIKKADFIYTTLESAELIKVSANAFLALKISFANSIAKLSDKVDADVVEVMDGIGKDRRIGRAFLNAGRGYGGGCFPKDVSGLISTAKDSGVELEIMSAASAVNSSMPDYVVDKLQSRAGTLRGKRIALLGLSFKAGTSDTRRSPSVVLANSFIKRGATVLAYDPEAKFEDGELSNKVRLVKNFESAVRGSNIAVVATDWPEFINMNFEQIAKLMKGNVLVDCMNALDKRRAVKAGLDYLGVGRS